MNLQTNILIEFLISACVVHYRPSHHFIYLFFKYLIESAAYEAVNYAIFFLFLCLIHNSSYDVTS
jgi:hypothetical protein